MNHLFLVILFSLIYTHSALGQQPTINPIKEEKKDQWNLTSYKPSFFLYNNDLSKVQASFKYKILRNSNLYLGYTHLIFCQLTKESRPIYDTNYNPELFYRFDINKPHIKSIDFIGIGHLSNSIIMATQNHFKDIIKKKMCLDLDLFCKIFFLYR